MAASSFESDNRIANDQPRRFKTVVIASESGDLCCPECNLVFLDEVGLRGHIFQCRMDHGVDPLLPLNVLLRPMKPAATASQTRSAKNRLFISSSTNRFSPQSTMVPVPPPSALLQGAQSLRTPLRSFGAAEDYLVHNVIPPSIARDTEIIPSSRRGRAASASVSGASASNHTMPSSWQRALLSVALPMISRRSGDTQPDERAKSLYHALHALTALSKDDPWILDLSGVTITLEDATSLARLLVPCRGVEPLPLVAVDVRGANFDSSKAEMMLMEAILKHPHISQFTHDNTTRWQTSTKRATSADSRHDDCEHRVDAINTMHSHDRNSSLLSRVTQHCATNAERQRRAVGKSDLIAQADAFKSWKHDRARERHQMAEDHGTLSKNVIHDEELERAALVEQFSGIVAAQRQHERRMQIREKKQHQRLELTHVEYTQRGVIVAHYFAALLSMLESIEDLHRRHLQNQRERLRMLLRASERENAFRAKVRALERSEREAVERLRVERESEVRMQCLLDESAAALDMLYKQKSRHKTYSVWRRRQREDVEQLIKQERAGREALEKEEDAYFSARRELLARSIEATFQRYAAQREHVESGEINVREVLENAFTAWMQISQSLFESESRLISLSIVAKAREKTRLSMLDCVPQLCLDGLPATLLMTCAASPGHPPNELTRMIPSTATLRLSMPPDWTHKYHEANQKSKKCGQEEQAAYLDHMQLLYRFSRTLQDAYEVVFQTSLEDLRTRHMQPMTRMQQIMNPNASQVQRAAIVPPFGSWTLQQDEVDKSPSMTKAKSKRRLSQAPPPTEPVTDDAFLMLASESLKWRAAWFDRHSPQHIKNEKETILHAFVEFTVDDAPSSPSRTADVTKSDHRLSTSTTTRPYFVDEVLVEPATASTSLGSPRSGIGSDDDQSNDGTLDDIPQHPSASHSLRVDIAFPSNMTSRRGGHRGDLATDTLFDVSTPRSNQGEDTGLPISPRKGANTTSNAITIDDVLKELQNVLYQCVVDGALLQQQQGNLSVGLAKIDFCVAVTIASADTYDAAPPPDVFGYCLKAPDLNRRTSVVETRGTVFVAVLPSYFHVVPPGTLLPITLPPRVLVEKQMDEVIVFPQFHRVDGPKAVQISKVNASVISCEEALQGFAGGILTIEVLHGTPSDRLSFRDDLPAFKLECSEKSKAIKTFILNGSVLGEIIDGAAQSSKFVTAANNMSVSPKVVVSLKDTKSPAARIGPDAVKFLLQRLRLHNFDDGPVEGRRVVRVSLKSASGANSLLDTHFEVESIDKPTELRIAYPKIVHRAPFLSCAPQLKANLANFFVPLFPQAVVFDEDTDRFSGGHLRLTLTNGVKGDTLVFVPDSRVLNVVDEMLETTPVLRVIEQCKVVFEDRVVATIAEGSVASGVEWMDSFMEETTTINFDFASDDMCSIGAVQAILRHTAMFTNPGLRLPHNSNQQRDIVVELQIQDNEQPTFINESISVRGAGHSIQLPDKAALIDFKEGSAAIKLGNVDISNDRVKPITTFGGSYVLAYIADGYSEGDYVSLKPDDTEYKLLDPKKSASGAAGSGGATSAGGGKGGASAKSSKASNVLREKAKQVGAAAAANNLSGSGVLDRSQSGFLQRPSLMAEVATTLVNSRLSRVKQDLIFAGASAPMATVQTTKCGGVLVNFQKDTKKETVTRKQVVTILRNLTFFSPPNPSVGFKVVRVLFADDLASTPTQVLIGVRLESVDDVTEIRMRSPKKQCLQQLDANFPLCPFGRCVLVDEDTEFLDGGHFVVQCIAGSTRGDFFNFVPPAQQPSLPLQRQAPSIDGFVGTTYDMQYNSADRAFLCNGVEVGKVDLTNRDGGTAEVKISFSRDASSAKPGLVPLHMASYMINSILFGNALDKLRDTTRQFQLRIKDAENPVEGKLKLQLELLPPHMVFGPATAGSQTASAASNETFVNRMAIGGHVGSYCCPGARIVIQVDAISSTATGYVKIKGAQAAKTSIVVPKPFLEESNMRMTPSWEIVTATEPPQLVLRLHFSSPYEMEFGFSSLSVSTPSSAPSQMKVRQPSKAWLQAFLRALIVQVEEPLEVLNKALVQSSIDWAEAMDSSATSSPQPAKSRSPNSGTPCQGVPALVIDDAHLDIPSERRASQTPTTSPATKGLLPLRSPRGGPRPTSTGRRSFQSFNEDDDEESIQVKFGLSDGKNISQLSALLLPRKN